MYILGLAGYNHDAAVAVVKDGELIAAAMEERFTRVKHQDGFPRQAIQYCLKEAGITEHDLDHVIYANNLWGLRGFKRILPYVKNIVKSPLYSSGFVIKDIYDRMWITFLMKTVARQGRRAQIHCLDHHLAHMASSFFVAPFDSSAIFSIDSMGDGDTTVLGDGTGNRIRKLSVVNYPHSIAESYCCVTNYFGFRTQDEYKVMGLSSYGKPVYYDKLKKLVQFTDDGGYRIDTDYFWTSRKPGRFEGYVSPKFIEEFGPQRQPGEKLEERHHHIAASLQKLYEETVFHGLRHLHKITRDKRLCLSGGGALNSVMNGKITLETPFEEVYIPPAPGDEGGAIGSAFYLSNDLLKGRKSFVMKTAFFGPAFSDDEIERALKEAKSPYRCSQNVAAETAALIAKGNIVGWFQGRMEWGARALGARSILADPTRADMTDIVNSYVKHREDFRPFAPSVLKERAKEFFLDIDLSPFMSFVTSVRPDKAKMIPAVVHVDGTARLQTVEKDLNPLYWKVIREFENLTGVPVVLNTSFNVKGEPVVCTPRDAIRCYYSTGIDCLVIGSFILAKT